jgi:hypothetical protein
MPSESRIAIGVGTLIITYAVTAVIKTMETQERHNEIKNDLSKILSAVEQIKK